MPRSGITGLSSSSSMTTLFLVSWGPSKLFSIVQFSRSVVSDSLQPHGMQHTRLPCPAPTPGASQTHVRLVGGAILPSHPPPSPSPPALNLSQHQGLSSESVLRTKWPKYWSFSFSISPSNEYSQLISFRMDWFPLGWLLAVKGTLKSLLQHHSSKASVLQCSAFVILQLSHPYMATGKTRALPGWTFVGKVMSLLFNMLYRLVITFYFHGCSHHLQWFWSPKK